MLRDLVQARGTSAELEAMTAERDFFREKYIEQVDELEELRVKLKESQRVVDKLRSQILVLEAEKARASDQGEERKSPKQADSAGSTNTSVTCLTYDDECTTKSGAEDNPVHDGRVVDSSIAGDNANIAPLDNAGEAEGKGSVATVDSICKRVKQFTPEGQGELEKDEEEQGHEEDEAENIRANAARMLLWANYQTSKRSTPNTSMIQESINVDDESQAEEGSCSGSLPNAISDAIVYSLPTSLDKRQLLDDDSTLGSSSRQYQLEPSVESWKSGATIPSAKIGNLFNNLRDMIDPRSEGQSEFDSHEELTDCNS